MAAPVTPLRFSQTPPPAPSSNTEQAVMRMFVADHADKLRFDHTRGRWFVWKEHYWQEDDRKRAFYWALEHCHGVKKTERIGFASAIETAARAMPPLATAASSWNTNPTLIACPSGVIDLETGAMRDGKPEDMINRCLSVTPDAACPGDIWFDFLATVFPQDGVVDFLMRWCGYSLSGLISEQKFLFLHGTGANGKGTFMGTLAQIWGELCATAPIDVFLESRNDRHSTEIARLAGPHMVQIHETREGRRWDEAKIKNLTGGDKLTARFMRQDDFEFVPRFKPIFAGNHKPHLHTVDEAMGRRILMLPCSVTIPVADRDPKLGEKLMTEAPRILAWAIEGFALWRRVGLRPPDTILASTADYLANQDDVRLWLLECTDPDPGNTTASKDLFLNWTQWKTLRGEFVGSQRSFNEKLVDKGFIRHTPNTGVVFENIKIKGVYPSAYSTWNSP